MIVAVPAEKDAKQRVNHVIGAHEDRTATTAIELRIDYQYY